MRVARGPLHPRCSGGAPAGPKQCVHRGRGAGGAGGQGVRGFPLGAPDSSRPGAGPEAAHTAGALCQPGDLGQGSSPSGLGVLPVKGCSLGAPPAAAPGLSTRALAPVAGAEVAFHWAGCPAPRRSLRETVGQPRPEMKEKSRFRGSPLLVNSGTSRGNESKGGGARARWGWGGMRPWSRAEGPGIGREEEWERRGLLSAGFDDCAESASSHLQRRCTR